MYYGPIAVMLISLFSFPVSLLVDLSCTWQVQSYVSCFSPMSQEKL